MVAAQLPERRWGRSATNNYGGTMVEFTGGCLCGNIRYKVSGDIVRVVNCHCDDCRHNTGAAFATNVFVKEDDLEITQGTPKLFEHVADSGNPRLKKFCAACGSQLFSTTAGRPITSVKVGSIDDASDIKTDINLYWPRALPKTWVTDDQVKHDGMPKG